MRSFARIVVLACAALALAACGGGGEGSGEDARGIDTSNTVYQAARDICSADTAKVLEETYRTPSSKPEDIANAIATNLAGGIPGDEEAARQGCIDGLESQG